MVEIVALLIVTFFPIILSLNFKEAGVNPLYTIIPFYNYWLWLKIIGKPKWWFLLLMVPFINLFMIFLMLIETSKSYLRNDYISYLAATLVPIIYFPVLGFSKKARYVKPDELPVIEKSSLRSWISSIIWALVLATILGVFVFRNYQIPSSSMERSMMVGDYLAVCNLTYGAKIPNTILSIPFLHNKLPFTLAGRSYVEWIKLPNYRLPGLRDIRRNDIVVFNYPAGDTVIAERQNEDYYRIVREAERHFSASLGNRYKPGMGRDYIRKNYKIIARPSDKCDNYVKRCVAIAGDTLQIIDQQVFINGIASKNPEMMQTSYLVNCKNYNSLSDSKLRKLNISEEDTKIYKNYHILQLTDSMSKIISEIPNVISVERLRTPQGVGDPDILPYDTSWRWNVDNLGPLWIPKAGESIALTNENVQLYGRCISVYEGNDLQFKDGKYFLNGEESNSYIFKMDYYWMMGDNRHNSLDSRYWGFVPESHIVGTPLIVLFSKDKDKSLFKGFFRKDRFFKIPR